MTVRLVDLIEEYLLVWVLASVAFGVVVPEVAVLTPLSTPILAVMIGSISLTLSPAAFRAVRGRAVGTILVVQAGLPVVAFAIASLLSLSPELTVGFVVLGAVTPELVAPVMTDLAGGDTALSTTVLVLVGLGTLVRSCSTVSGTLLAGSRRLDSIDPNGSQHCFRSGCEISQLQRA